METDYSQEPIKRKGIIYYRFECIDCGAYHYCQKVRGLPHYLRCLSCAAKLRGTGRTCSEETKKKISTKLMGHPSTAKSGIKHTKEQNDAQSKARKGIPSTKKGKHYDFDDVTRKRMSEASKRMWQKEGFKDNYSQNRKGLLAGEKHPLWGKHHSEETRKKQSLAKKGKSHRNYFNEEQMIKASERLYSYMKTHTLSKYNKTEQYIDELLQEMFPAQYKYNGSHDLGFKIFAHAPDFVNVNGQKKIIEFNGCVWHCCPICGKEKHPHGIPYERVRAKDERDIKRANELGYKVLTIWSHDLKDMDKVKKDLVSFHNE